MQAGSPDRVDRRLAAILAADVVGYSRLMEADEAGTARLLREHRAAAGPLVAEHGGRIVKNTGDGVLVEFPSVVGAVQCAVALQKLMAEHNAGIPGERRMDWRIGIHLADILTEGDDILGDGVNLAARLEGIAHPGGICISEDAFRQVRGKIETEFLDGGEQVLKNIARPMRIYRAQLTPTLVPLVPATTALSLPDKPSLVVLPFQNMTGDLDQEYFVDGMVEELTTAIARLPWLLVIARNSSFTYKGKTVDVKRVAQELGVRYVLEGSVRKAGNRVRITGQLIDTVTSAHIWADHFDGTLEDIFELQDQVASNVAGAIEPQLRQSEIDRAIRKPTESLDAYDLYLRGLRELYKVTFDGNQEALRLFKDALSLDASYAPAAGMTAWGWAARKYHNLAPVSEAEVSEAVRLARTAIEVGKDDPDTLSRAAWALGFFTGEVASALRAVDRAVALNPNSAYAWGARGWILVWMEQPEQAVECFTRAMRLSPLDPTLWAQQYGMARCLFVMGRLDEALQWADKSLLEQPRAVNVTVFKLGVCGQLGLTEEARRCLQRLAQLSPGFSIATFAAQVVPRGVSARITMLWADGLRAAGVPEE